MMDEESKTICWGCARALAIRAIACPWSWSFLPVPGWTAIRHDIGKQIESYIVVRCPLFLNDQDYLKAKYDEEKNVNQDQTTKQDVQMLRFDTTTKLQEDKYEIIIKEKTISLPRVDTFEVDKTIVVLVSKDGSRIEFEQGENGFPVSACGQGGKGRVIKPLMVIAYLKKCGVELPARAEVKCNGAGKWTAQLQLRGRTDV